MSTSIKQPMTFSLGTSGVGVLEVSCEAASGQEWLKNFTLEEALQCQLTWPEWTDADRTAWAQHLELLAKKLRDAATALSREP